MNYKSYSGSFLKAADKLDKKMLQKKEIEVAVGEVLNSVYLKLYKKTWTSSTQDPLSAESRIFFSIWVNDATLQEQKIFYNIHAFKLRKLNGYSIESRKFANAFRTSFEKDKHKWKNASTDFGPLTLMQGWIPLDNEKVEKDILELANNFLEIEHLIDKALLEFKK